MVGCRSVEDIKAAIQINLIKNNPVNNESVQWATNICGPDFVQLKAQTNSRRPNTGVDASIDIPDELLEV